METSPNMIHRHLNHQNLTAPAIDDIIARGGIRDWAELRKSVLLEKPLMEKVHIICLAHNDDPHLQRYRFWMHYVKKHLA